MPSTIEALLIFLCFVAPGFLLAHVWDYMVTRTKPEAGHLVLRSLTYSALWWSSCLVGARVLLPTHIGGWLLPLLAPLLELSLLKPITSANAAMPGDVLLLPAGVIVLAPIVAYLGARTVKIFPRLPAYIGFQLLQPTAWDYVFERLPPCFIRITLKDGRCVVGWWSRESYATSHPDPRDIYLQTLWRVDDEGSLVEPAPGSIGGWISGSEIACMELLEAESPGREITAVTGWRSWIQRAFASANQRVIRFFGIPRVDDGEQAPPP
ncbi:hypothetical protein HY631_04420 [Candidatus Uhrbacteria bacterium]|nr:hypothetical protein [Candidatus Uhrbacteria bacterium]